MRISCKDGPKSSVLIDPASVSDFVATLAIEMPGENYLKIYLTRKEAQEIASELMKLAQ